MIRPPIEGVPGPSIAEAIASCARGYGPRAALLAWRDEAWQEVSFPDLANRVESAARALVAEGTRPGDRVAVLGPNSPEWGQAYLAVQRAGGVAVPLDRLQTVHEWVDVLARAGATRIFVAHGEGVRLLPLASEALPGLRAYSLRGELEHTVASLDDLVNRQASAALPDVAPDQLASLIFTSGTTGRSKGVMLTHRNILANALGMLARIEIDNRTDRFLSVLPMSYCYECTCGFVAPLLAGVPVYYARGLAPREILSDLERSGATFLLGVPMLFEKFNAGVQRGLREAGMAGRVSRFLWGVSSKGRPLWGHRFGRLLLKSVRDRSGLGALRYLVSGGAPLPPSVGKGLRALGVPLLQGYGLTETSPVVTLHPPSETDPVSVGTPLPGVEVKIHEPSESGDGEIWVRGVTVMRGYWEDEESTRAALQDGWFRTGDLGRFDRRGHLCITGRLKNLIVSPGGKNISPEEIEAAAQLCPAVSEIVVYGRPTALGSGEEVCARIFPNLEYAGAQGWPLHDAAALLANVRSQVDEATSRLAAYKKIIHYDLAMEPFEKTTSHKIKRQKYRVSLPARP